MDLREKRKTKFSILVMKRFSLVELLIVITILSLLLMLLLPMLKTAIKSSQISKCKNTLKQWGVGFEMYADDFNGYFPTVETWSHYFHGLNVSNKSDFLNHGLLYKSGIFDVNDPSLLFCDTAETGYANYDIGHPGFGAEDYSGVVKAFNGVYQAGSYIYRPCDEKGTWWSAPVNRGKHSLKSISASELSILVDIFGVWAGGFLVDGHDYLLNRLFGDGSVHGEYYFEGSTNNIYMWVQDMGTIPQPWYMDFDLRY